MSIIGKNKPDSTCVVWLFFVLAKGTVWCVNFLFVCDIWKEYGDYHTICVNREVVTESQASSCDVNPSLPPTNEWNRKQHAEGDVQ